MATTSVSVSHGPSTSQGSPYRKTRCPDRRNQKHRRGTILQQPWRPRIRFIPSHDECGAGGEEARPKSGWSCGGKMPGFRFGNVAIASCSTECLPLRLMMTWSSVCTVQLAVEGCDQLWSLLCSCWAVRWCSLLPVSCSASVMALTRMPTYRGIQVVSKVQRIVLVCQICPADNWLVLGPEC